jgi:hypothetical protein
MRIKNYLNRDSFPKNYQTFTQPSETIPDQTLSIRQILDRHSRGIPMDVKTPIWDENPDIDDILPNPQQMDLSERQEYAIQAKAELEAIKTMINTKKPKKTQNEAKNEQSEE